MIFSEYYWPCWRIDSWYTWHCQHFRKIYRSCLLWKNSTTKIHWNRKGSNKNFLIFFFSMTFYGFYDLCFWNVDFWNLLSFFKEIKNASSELIYQVMITSYGFQKDQISIRTCWGEAGGFLDTTKLSEKVNTTAWFWGHATSVRKKCFGDKIFFRFGRFWKNFCQLLIVAKWLDAFVNLTFLIIITR